MKLFFRLVDLIKHSTKEEAANVQQAALDWGKAFLDLGRKGFRGFQPKNLTPYCHLVITHAAEQVARDGPLNRFSGERLERCNDEIKQLHLRQTNCKEIETSFQLQKRYEMARRKKEIKVMQRNAKKVPKMSCQVNLVMEVDSDLAPANLITRVPVSLCNWSCLSVFHLVGQLLIFFILPLTYCQTC